MKKKLCFLIAVLLLSSAFGQNADTTRITALSSGPEINEAFAGRIITGDLSVAIVDGKKMLMVDYTITGESDEEFYGVETYATVDQRDLGYGFVGDDESYAGELFPLTDTTKTAVLVVELHYTRMRCQCPSNDPDRVFIFSLADFTATPGAEMPPFDSVKVNMLDNVREKYATEWDEMQAAYKARYRWSAEVQIRYYYDVVTDIMTIRIPGGTRALIGATPDLDGFIMLTPYYRRYKANGRRWIELTENPFDYKGDSFNPRSATVELK